MADKPKTTDRPAIEPGTVAKCAACETEQAATHKFCGGCGQPMASAARAEYDTALAQLGEFHKAATKLSPTLEVKPGDHPDAGTVAKSGTGEIDEGALVSLLIGGNHQMVDRLVAISDEVRANRIGLGEAAGLIAKALTTGFTAQLEPLMARVEQLHTEFAAWRDQPGRSRAAHVTTVHKSATTIEDAGEDASLSGNLLVKAAIELGNAKKITDADVTEVEYWANRNVTLKALPSVAPGLAARLQYAGLTAVEQ